LNYIEISKEELLMELQELRIENEFFKDTYKSDITKLRKAEELLKKKNEELIIAKEKAELSERITKSFSLELTIEKEKTEQINAKMTALLQAMPDIMLVLNNEGFFIDHYVSVISELLTPTPKIRYL
jgi:hypothetical protein